MDLAALLLKLEHDAGAVSADAKYAPCAQLVSRTEAAIHFDACVAHLRAQRPELTATQAAQMERAKIGYYAGFQPFEVRLRIETLYGCVHPFAGRADAKDQKRPIQLSADFDQMVAAWDKQPPDSRSFGMHAQPTWDLRQPRVPCAS